MNTYECKKCTLFLVQNCTKLPCSFTLRNILAKHISNISEIWIYYTPSWESHAFHISAIARHSFFRLTKTHEIFIFRMNEYEFSAKVKTWRINIIPKRRYQFSKEQATRVLKSNPKNDSNASSKMNFVYPLRRKEKKSIQSSIHRWNFILEFHLESNKSQRKKIRKYSPRRARTNLFTFTQTVGKSVYGRSFHGEEYCITLMSSNFSTCPDPRNETQDCKNWSPRRAHLGNSAVSSRGFPCQKTASV